MSLTFSKACAALLKGEKETSETILPNLCKSWSESCTALVLAPISSCCLTSNSAYPLAASNRTCVAIVRRGVKQECENSARTPAATDLRLSFAIPGRVLVDGAALNYPDRLPMELLSNSLSKPRSCALQPSALAGEAKQLRAATALPPHPVRRTVLQLSDQEIPVILRRDER